MLSRSVTRVRRQRGAFTLHGKRCKALDKMSELGGALWSVKVPPTAKIELRRQLEAQGVTRRDLFPDLENLARDIAEAS